MEISAGELCQLLNGTIEGDSSVMVNQPSKIEEGGIGTITFLANPKYEAFAYTTTASVLLVNQEFKPTKPISATLIRVEDVYASIALLLEKFGEASKVNHLGISKDASIHSSAKMGSEVSIGNFSVVSEGVDIGNNTIIHSQVFLGEKVKVGENVTIYPGVKIYHSCEIGDNCIIHSNAVIGADGFGFAPQNGVYKKIPQIGNVVLESDVEIGASTTIDRATLGSTMIRQGVKIDNLVQVGHNVEIGKNTAIAAQVGIAGSAKIGKNCMVAGQVGFVGHIKVADGTKIQAQSGVATNIKKEGTAIGGTPAYSYLDYIKSLMVFKKLPGLYKKIHVLEKKLQQLEQEKG